MLIDNQFYKKSFPRVLCFILMNDILYKKYNCMESHTTTSKPSTNTPTTCDTQESKYNRYTLSLFVNLQSFFSFWIACDTPSIELDTTEQQVARHNKPNIYIHTKRQQNIQISTTSGENFYTVYNTNQKKRKKTGTSWPHIQLTSTYCKTCIIHPITLVTLSSMYNGYIIGRLQ